MTEHNRPDHTRSENLRAEVERLEETTEFFFDPDQAREEIDSFSPEVLGELEKIDIELYQSINQ